MATHSVSAIVNLFPIICMKMGECHLYEDGRSNLFTRPRDELGLHTLDVCTLLLHEELSNWRS